MTEMEPCSGNDWTDSCLWMLSVFVTKRYEPGIRDWVERHVDGSAESWNNYAAALGGLAAAAMEEQLEAAGLNVDKMTIVPQTVGADENPAIRDGLLFVTMLMNDDGAGARGVLSAWHENGRFIELCGVLASIASTALRGQVLPMPKPETP